ncbi:MAG: MFS transporter, partial [Chloroflexi bacterium]|nr:MFS transporter [Chloroflexota bacterium]
MTGVFKRPRLYYGWWIVATGSLVAGIGSVNLMGFTVFFLPLSRELGTTRAVTSLVHSVSRLEGGLLGPVAGWAIDRFGARRILAFGSVLGGLGFILLGAAVHSVWALFLVYGLVVGVGFNTGFFPAVLATVNIWFVRRRTIAMSIVNASWGAAAFVLVPALSLITIRYGWRVAAVFAGCLVLLSAIPALLFIRRSPESMGLRPDGAGDPDGPSGTLPAGAALQGHAIEPDDGDADLTVREALSSPAYWLLVVATNLRMLAYSAILVHFAPLLIWKGLSPQTAANLIGLWSLLVIPASLAGGYLGDRGNKRLI